jgi:hypothetical protein
MEFQAGTLGEGWWCEDLEWRELGFAINLDREIVR